MTRQTNVVPFKEGLWVIEADRGPRLLASQCTFCSEIFFPAKTTPACTHCQHESLERVAVGPYGRLMSYTAVEQPPAGGFYRGPVPYALGLINLDDGVRVEAHLRGDFNLFHVGMRMQLTIETLFTDPDKNDVQIYCFRQAGATGD